MRSQYPIFHFILLAVLAVQFAHAQTDDITALKKKAEQGNASSQISLGFRYLTGQGIPQDYKEAVKWYRKAAEQGDAAGQYGLGVLYDKGQGVPQDYKEAVKWYRKAAEQGNAVAQSNLGSMYGNGQGVPQDYIEAHKWLNLAAAEGNEIASKNRDIVAKRMTPEQIAEAQKLAREWKPMKAQGK